MNSVEIDNLVQEYQKTAPVDVFNLARAMGIQVKRSPHLGDDIAGLIRKDRSGSYRIVTNASHPIVRRRFTVAHEIAHFVLHRDLIGDGIKDDVLYRSGLGGALEVQANSYAANILMPWHLIMEIVEKLPEDSTNLIEELAEKLRVSKTAMSIRLGIPWE